MNESKYTYVLLGDPAEFIRKKQKQANGWDAQKHTKMSTEISLTDQHANYQPLGTPLHLDITFFMDLPPRNKRNAEKLYNTIHFMFPDLSEMVRFIEIAGEGIIFTSRMLITSTSSKKLYSDTPRTEFTFTEIK